MPLCYLRFLRREIFRIFSANTARFFASPPFFFAAAIFFVVAFPKAPTVPLRFIFLVAFCIQFLFFVAITGLLGLSVQVANLNGLRRRLSAHKGLAWFLAALHDRQGLQLLGASICV